MVHLITTLLMASAFASTPEQSNTIAKLEDKLMAPCCYSQTIRVHMSAEAEQMREEVTDMVIAGKSERDIIKYYKTKYGETILVVPDGGAGQIAFGVPITVALSAFGLLAVGMGRVLRRRNLEVSLTQSICAEEVRPGVIEKIRRDVCDDF